MSYPRNCSYHFNHDGMVSYVRYDAFEEEPKPLSNFYNSPKQIEFEAQNKKDFPDNIQVWFGSRIKSWYVIHFQACKDGILANPHLTEDRKNQLIHKLDNYRDSQRID